jgi:hypothetical protein
MGSNMDARIASSAKHSTCHVASNAAGEETEDFAALWESAGAVLEASEVATEYTIAIQQSPGAPLVSRLY